MSNVQAIHRRTIIDSITFSDVPSKETREVLGTQGYKYRNGNWFKSKTEGGVLPEEIVAQKAIA